MLSLTLKEHIMAQYIVTNTILFTSILLNRTGAPEIS